MEIKEVKYAQEVAEGSETCDEGSDVCEENDELYHVWFDDGTSITVCKACFDKHVNDGSWTTEETDRLKPS